MLPFVIENINPDLYAQSIAKADFSIAKIKVNALKFEIPIKFGESLEINPTQPTDKDGSGKYKYVILGDNRDVYDIFGQSRYSQEWSKYIH